MAVGASQTISAVGASVRVRRIGVTLAIWAMAWSPAAASGAQEAGGSNALMEYGTTYVLMLLAIGLGTFIICRPKPAASKTEK
jgi:hypothetical protein